MDNDEYFMNLALDLAAQGQFSAAPNPCVGCIIVKNNEIIGCGFHQEAGDNHAEINALNMANTRGGAENADVYVSLEPCSHFGKTPPCADALIKAKVKRVIVACSDANPLVYGRGLEKLKSAGIEVITGVCQEKAIKINREFFHRQIHHKPFIKLKIAASIDARTALNNGESKWITGEKAREDVHKMRLKADCVLAGSSSIIVDNAKLNSRYKTPLPAKQALRVIIDSELKTPHSAEVFKINSPILIATLQKNSQLNHYPDFCEILSLPANSENKVDLNHLLTELGKREINQVFAECGANLAGAFIKENLADEIILYLSANFLGHNARPLAYLPELTNLQEKYRYSFAEIEKIGEDLKIVLSKK